MDQHDRDHRDRAHAAGLPAGRMRITNTAGEAADIGSGLMSLMAAEAAIFGGERMVARQEAEGQCELVMGDSLPVRGSEDPTWDKWGLILGAPFEDDPLFRRAALPRGWRKVPTDHAMWSRIVDDLGRRRGSIFYKADFWDRDASMSPCRRFRVIRADDLPRYVAASRLVMDVRDGERVIHRLVESVPDKRTDRSAHNEAIVRLDPLLREQCCRWLDAHVPSHRDPVAEWDEPELEAISDLSVATDARPHYWIDCKEPDKGRAIAEAIEDHRVVFEVEETYTTRHRLEWDSDLGPIFCPCQYDAGNGARQASEAATEKCAQMLDQRVPGWRTGDATISLTQQASKEGKSP